MRFLRQFGILLSREVESLFLSPIGYGVLTVGLLLNGFSFYTMLLFASGNVEQTVRLFFGGNVLFWVVMLFLPPLFTMRLFAEERKSGTLEMLLTAPVGELEVVLSKFCAGLVFYLALWAPSLMYVAVVKSYGAIPEWGQLFTCYLGITLLGALFVAVGLVASSLTSNQILAAVLATVGNILLFLFPFVAQFVESAEVERFFQELSIQQHFTDSFSKGVVDTAHVSCYVVAVGVCLFWTTRILESQRWR